MISEDSEQIKPDSVTSETRKTISRLSEEVKKLRGFLELCSLKESSVEPSVDTAAMLQQTLNDQTKNGQTASLRDLITLLKLRSIKD